MKFKEEKYEFEKENLRNMSVEKLKEKFNRENNIYVLKELIDRKEDIFILTKDIKKFNILANFCEILEHIPNEYVVNIESFFMFLMALEIMETDLARGYFYNKVVDFINKRKKCEEIINLIFNYKKATIFLSKLLLNKDFNELLELLEIHIEFKYEILYSLTLKNNLLNKELEKLFEKIDFFCCEKEDKRSYFYLLNNLYKIAEEDVINRIEKISQEEIIDYGEPLLHLLIDNKNLKRKIVKKILLPQKYIDSYLFEEIFFNYPYLLLKYIDIQSKEIINSKMEGIKETYMELFEKNKIKFLYRIYKKEEIRKELMKIFELIISDFEISYNEIDKLKISSLKLLDFLTKMIAYFTNKKLMITSLFFNIMEKLKLEKIYNFLFEYYFWLYFFNHRNLEEILKKYVLYDFCGKKLNDILIEFNKYSQMQEKNYSLKELVGNLEVEEYYNFKYIEMLNKVYQEEEKKGMFFSLMSAKIQLKNKKAYLFNSNNSFQELNINPISVSVEIPYVEELLDPIGFIQLKNELFYSIKWEMK